LGARIILLAVEGCSTRSIARAVGAMPRTVSTWRGRFARKGLAGLADQPRPGPVPKDHAETGWRILAVLERAPPSGLARWTGPLIATELGDVHVPQVWRFLRAAVTFRDADGHPSRSRSAPKASLIPAPRRKQCGATGVNAKISSQDDRLSGSFLPVTAAVHHLTP
jgi:transposase